MKKYVVKGFGICYLIILALLILWFVNRSDAYKDDNYSYVNFVSDVEITNMSGTYSEAEQYLSLIKESDKAFEELVYYFSKWKEPIIIMMFGDHQPAIEQEFFEEMYGKTIIVGDFNIPLTSMDRPSRQKINKATVILNDRKVRLN